MKLTRTLPSLFLGCGLTILILVALCAHAAVEDAPERQDHQHPARLRDAAGEHAISSSAQWSARRSGILERMQQVMGKLPDRTKFPPADVFLGEETKGDGFTRVALTYVADGTDRVPAHLYLPANRAPGKRLPAIIALHQTSVNGKADLGGGAKNPNNSYAPELARRGYIVICPDYPSFGELKGYDFAKDSYESGTMKGIVNHMRAVDVLVTRDDVDPDRIGAIGHSLGGHNAIFLGVFDERIKVVVSSCGWTPFHDYYGGNLKGWTQDRYMPRICDAYGSDPDKVPFDFPELIAAIAPRAFFSISPTRDANFSVDGVKRGIEAATPIFDLLSAKDKLQVRNPDDEHNFSPAMREEAFAFVDRVLGNESAKSDPAKPQAATAPTVAEEDFAAELPRIAATEPPDALKKFQILPGFHVEMAASEPNVASPVAIDFDEAGRMFVCEMRDYSEQDKERLGTIRMLEDVDGDGTYEKSTIFADDLSWPTAIICYGGGIFVAAAPDVYWLKDTNGDGKVDERKTVFTGFHRTNVQGLVNCLRWGIDNRIYGATSSSGGNVRRPEQPEADAINLSGRDFSFDPKTLQLRAESGGAQHGMSFDDWGRTFVSSNSDHIQMVMIDDRYISGEPHVTVPSARESIAADGPQATVFRISPIEPWRIVRTRLRVSGAVKGMIEGGGTPAGYFTGATGVTIYRGDAFPPEYRGQAFIGDVGSNIVHRKVLEPNGVGFIAKRVDQGKEFLASTDVWFRPSQFANTPDGSLYVIDTCRETIEHPASLPPMIKKHLDLTSGRERGRIWRVAPDGFKRRPNSNLTTASTADLVALLEHRNGWHRDTAARLLFERQDKAAIPLLEKVATTSAMPEARVHAMYALASMNALTADVIQKNLASDQPRVIEHAIRLVEQLATPSDEIAKQLQSLVTSSDSRVRYQLTLTYGALNKLPNRPAMALMKSAGDSRWMQAAAFALAKENAAEMLQAMLAEPDRSAESRERISDFAQQVGTKNQPADVEKVLKAAGEHRDLASELLVGLSEGLTVAGASLQDKIASQPDAKKALDELLAAARRDAGDGKADMAKRVAAIRLLPIGTFAESQDVLTKSISGNQPQDVQLAALAALDRFAAPAVGTMVTKGWPGMTPAVRAAAGNVIFARPERAAAFLDAVEAGSIKSTDIDRARLQGLATTGEGALRDRAKKLLEAAPNAARQPVFEAYQPALTLQGNAANGKVLFEKTCAGCHKINDVGQEIGPNLAAMKSRGAEAILLNVIDPNREVNPQYVDYLVQTKSGRTSSGLLASETASGITLKRAGGETETIARSDIKRMKSTGLSIMPEGLEAGLDRQAMADLIAYVLTAK